MYKISSVILLVSVLFSVLVFSYASAEEGQKVIVTRKDMLDVAKELHPPGCLDPMTADYCTIRSGYEMRAEITEMLGQGKKKQQIIDELVLKYGTQILAAPKAEGFHLIAWVLPGISIVAGGTIIGFLLSAWVRHTRSGKKEIPFVTTVSKEQEKEVSEELKQWL